jgi:hypothetical protein
MGPEDRVAVRLGDVLVRLDEVDQVLQGARLVSLAVWLAGVRRVEVTPDGALVGSPRRLLIVGQAPPRGGNLLPAFSGRSGARLRRLLGLGDEARKAINSHIPLLFQAPINSIAIRMKL